MVKGFIVYPDYTTIDNKTYIQLFGRLENGESFVCLKKIEPYFFTREEDEKQIERILKKQEYKDKVKIIKTNLTTFNEERVIKIIFENQTELNNLVKEIHQEEIDTFEADVKPEYRFIIDNNLLGNIEISGDYESSDRVDRVYKNPEIKPSQQFKPKLKIASLDIETSKEKNKLLCIGLSSEKYKKVFMITDKKLDNFVISCKDEEDCIEKFKQELIKLDPDIITGWSVIDFDFDFLKNLFQKHKITFDLGRTNDNARIRIEDNYFRASKMDIPGRLVLDGLGFIKDPFIQEAPSIKNIKFENYTLEEVSQQILGKGKLMHGKEKYKEIEKLFQGNREDQQKLADYNINDCILVQEILEKTKTIELSIERSELTGMPLDRLTASIASFDSLYIREARKKGLVSPTAKFSNKEQKILGGYVMSPNPGIYHNVLVLDFKSLYPSILKTFNIDPSSLLKKHEKNSIVSPNNVYFKNADGILPDIIQKLHEAREKAKKEKRELSSYAIKIIMNSFWGVLASPNCRYFNFDMANAITGFARMIIQLTAKKIEELGYNVIYSDTDSVFINTNLDKEKSEKLGEQISEHIDRFYEKFVKENYNRKSYLDLEFDKLYIALLMPSLRMHEKKSDEKVKKEEGEKKEVKGAKKRYAGLVEENGKETLDVVGLEAIRGDWTDVAQEFQRALLLKVFKKQNPTEYIKEIIKEIKSGKLDSKLIYRKSIRKDLQEYTKTTPPHVKAARKLDSIEGNIIEYYITEDGPEPIQKLKHKIDYEHYIEKQIKPIAKTILDSIGLDFDVILSGTKQKTLF
jgi:DNA polymerase-2